MACATNTRTKVLYRMDNKKLLYTKVFGFILKFESMVSDSIREWVYDNTTSCALMPLVRITFSFGFALSE